MTASEQRYLAGGVHSVQFLPVPSRPTLTQYARDLECGLIFRPVVVVACCLNVGGSLPTQHFFFMKFQCIQHADWHVAITTKTILRRFMDLAALMAPDGLLPPILLATWAPPLMLNFLSKQA